MAARLVRAASNEFCMEEADVMFESEAAVSKLEDCFSEDDECHDGDMEARKDVIPGGQSESAKSSTLGVTLEDCFMPAASERSPGAGMHLPTQAMPMSSMQNRSKYSRFQASSMPYKPAANMHGTSVPVDIPFMMRGTRSPMDLLTATLPEEYPDKFVPPHQLSQRAVMFSLHGESPASAFKRERLKARDVILKSTGFVERIRTAPIDMDTAPARAAETTPRTTPRSSLDIRGGLSQALNG